MGGYDYSGSSDIPDTIYVSNGCQAKQINIVPIVNVFANTIIDLPARIKNTKSCVNINNVENKCFLYCQLLHERYCMCNNDKIEYPERLHGEKTFVYNNEIIKLDYQETSFPISYNNFYVIKTSNIKIKLG